METKERKEQINKLLHEIARSDSQEAKWVREFIALHAEDAKERLVGADGVDIPRIQGEARLMERILKQFIGATALTSDQIQPPQ